MAERDEKTPVNELSLKASECPVTQVTVYKDRAQVCREVETTVKDGVNELRIKEFVEIDEESIRVEGKGNATIAEVSFQSKYVTEDEATMTEKEKSLKEQLKSLEEEKKALDIAGQQSALQKQWGILDQFAATAARHGQGNHPDEKKNFELDAAYFQGMREFMQQYKDIGKQLSAESLDLARKGEEIDKKIEVVKKNLREVQGNRHNGQMNRECVVVLEAEKETKVTLIVSYVVFGASWWPTYDLRMFTDLGSLKIFYYGLIRQSSGEDWTNVKLFLSTAEPSIGGTIPTLPMSQLSIKKFRPIRKGLGFGGSPNRSRGSAVGAPPPPPAPPGAPVMYASACMMAEPVMEVAPVEPSSKRYQRNSSGNRGATFRMKNMRLDEACAAQDLSLAYSALDGDGIRSDSMELEAATLREAPIATKKVKVSESTTSTTYEIARQSTIPSDNTEHKVTVAIIELKPALTYLTVPKVVPHAFLQAKVTNTSQYTFLAGKTNIFLDNSLVAKAEINTVSPKEEFECSLGVDPGVRVDYKPLVKFNSSSGIISKTQMITHEQAIEIKNMHDYKVKVMVRENLPRSLDEKIKVNLLSPVIDMKHPEKTEGVKLTKNNHIEWDIEVKNLEKTEVVLKYTVEHPASEDIETTTAVAN